MTKTNICFSDVFLLVSILLSLLFSYWLFQQTEDERIQEVIEQYNGFRSIGKKESANELINNITEFHNSKTPLNIKWLPLVFKIHDGYQRLALYQRILAHSPDKEFVYQVISNFMKYSPPETTNSIKKKYYSDLSKIKGIDVELLQKYGLLTDDT